MINYEWKPNVCFGPFIFGDNISRYIKKYNLKLDDDDSKGITGWVSYQVPETEVYISEREGHIIAAASYDQCNYKGKNLLDLTLNQLAILLEYKDYEIEASVEYDNGEVHTPVVFFHLGLTAWFVKNHKLKEEVVLYISVIADTDD